MKTNLLKEIVKKTVINSVVHYFEKNIDKRRDFQILDLIMPRERKIRSIVGGFETSMGRTLWEPLAKQIATHNGFVIVKANLEAPAIMPASLSSTLQIILEARENQNILHNGKTSHEAIKQNCQQFLANPISNFVAAPKGHGVDIWLRKEGIEYFFDTKTVQPNVGNFKGFMRQILNWYAYYYSKNPKGNAVGRIIFPYNPYEGNFWNKCKGGGRPLEKGTEAWVEDEFWDFISGIQGTFKFIKESFVELHNEKTLERHLDSLFK